MGFSSELRDMPEEGGRKKKLWKMELLFTLASSFFPLLFVALFSWSVKVLGTRRGPNKLPPSPPKLPVVGHLHRLGVYPHRSLHSLAQTHGPFMLIHLGSIPFLIASTADAAEEILKTHDLAFSSRSPTAVLKKITYNCKNVGVAPYGEHWRQAKRIVVVHLLSAAKVRSFRDVREEETSSMLERIGELAEEGKAVDLSKSMGDLVFDVSCRVYFGRKYLEEELSSGRCIRQIINETALLVGDFDVGEFIPWLAWVNRLTGFHAKVDRAARELDLMMERVVQDHDRSNDGGEREEVSGEGCSFVDILLSLEGVISGSGGFVLDRDAIKAILLDMFAAGVHTVFTILDWVMTELMRHPAVMRKLQEEVRQTSCAGKKIVYEDDVERMSYLRCVVKEVLRLHPAIPLLTPHASTEDVELRAGYFIPNGTRVLVNAWAIGRDPEFWELPEEFMPERFLDSPVDFKGSDFHFIPFGAGRRMCPGMGAGLVIVELAVANLVHGFDWSFPEGVTAEDLDLSEASGLFTNRKQSLLLLAAPHRV